MPTIGPASGAISHGLRYLASLHAVGLLLLQNRAANIILAVSAHALRVIHCASVKH